MEKIFAAITAIVAAADAVRDMPNSMSHLDTLSNVANDLISQIKTDVDQAIYNRDALTLEEKNLILSGQHIPAIKLIRTRTGFGLKDAKDMADKHREKVMHKGYDGMWYKNGY